MPGEEFASGVLTFNVAPTWVDYPTLYSNFNEFGVIVNSTISGIFSDVGTQDAHAVQILVNGTQRVYQEYAAGVIGFSLDVGLLTPGDGEEIVVKLIDDDLGAITFYITLATIVSKSFIANIYTTGGVGEVASQGGLAPDAAAAANVRLQGFGATSVAQFRENPGSPFSEGDFRLYSRDVYAVGYDGEQVQYFDYLNTGSALNAGFEFGVFQGEIEERNRYYSLNSSTSGIAGVFVHGRPDPFLEPGFDLVMTRTSSEIWFSLDVAFSVQDNYAKFSLVDSDSSAFPSNRIWIDAELEGNYQQSTFVKLWQSSPTLGGQYVAGRDETGIFEWQYYLVTENYWLAVEN